jgi:predicted metal-dependent enzyme (double-stranded beta helix superfamily)
MGECEELARERGEDPWDLAGRFAQHMLPRIFRPDDPALAVALAPETRQALEHLLADLPTEVFTADDALGWTYQFWQAERKEEVNRSGVKIGADELPAVTQLFTEHYMVQFLFHNSLGAWRAGKVLAARPELAESATSEEELRRAVRLGAQGGYDIAYLRFVREAQEGDEEGKPTGPWRPAAGTFEAWPRSAAELRVLDPCCGSGHFLVAGFELLVRLRMVEEGLALENAIRAVLAENLFGLEIDPRCTQIAAFNLALAAWKLAGRPIELPAPRIACTGLEVGGSREEWAKLAPDEHNLKLAMRWLYDEFRNSRELGSLLDPAKSPAAKLVPWKDLQPILDQALERDDIRRDPEATEAGIAAQGLARAAELLAGTYTLVITNVPYLGRGNQTNALKDFADEHHKEAKADLATIFVSRIFHWLGANGTQAVVTPQNWLFLTSYKKIREKLLSLRTWNLVAWLGPGAFETIGGHVVNVALSVLSAAKPARDWQMAGIDVSAPRSQRPIPAREKVGLLRGDAVAQDASSGTRRSVSLISQTRMLGEPGYRILLASRPHSALLKEVSISREGLSTGDGERFLHAFWEHPGHAEPWLWFQTAPERSGLFGGMTALLRWDSGGAVLEASGGARVQGQAAWGRPGVLVARVSSLRVCVYYGVPFDKNGVVITPHDSNDLAAIWQFCSSDQFAREVRRLDKKPYVTTAVFADLAFDRATWADVARNHFSGVLPEPQSDDPTQWLFHGHPAKAEPHAALQVAVARLLGYRWPPEHDPGMRLAAEAREWVARCGELDAFADKDGIVCLAPLRGEAGAADRLRRLLAAAFGSAWSASKERELLAAAAQRGAPAGSLEEWLRDSFFEEHCKLFHHRPFVWHLWDGRRDGFHCLVNAHKLTGPDGEGRRTLQSITFSYLGDWIERQRAAQRAREEGADARLAAALDLQAQLQRILTGEPPYDLFIRWKPLAEQPLGWEPDIDDGVRLNIRPFMKAELRTGGRKGASLLRWKPNIHWRKDRGQEPQTLRPKPAFPWFWSCPGDAATEARTDFPGGPTFDGHRWNDLHYTRAAKEAAREKVDAASRRATRVSERLEAASSMPNQEGD